MLKYIGGVMAFEIERRFLLKENNIPEWLKVENIMQGYLCIEKNSVQRVRIVNEKKAFFTVKGRSGRISRLEYQWEIPLVDAKEIMEKLCIKPLIVKKRYFVNYNGYEWVVDVFEGENEGLKIAEIELKNEFEKIEVPDWVGKEISEDERFYNYSLVLNPYSNWKGVMEE